jgi:hypothetical protein
VWKDTYVCNTLICYSIADYNIQYIRGSVQMRCWDLHGEHSDDQGFGGWPSLIYRSLPPFSRRLPSSLLLSAVCTKHYGR